MQTINTFDRFRLTQTNSFLAGNQNVSDIELVTKRKEKPKFDIHQEITNRTFIRPLPPKGHIVKNSIVSAPLNFVQDIKTDLIALKSAVGGDANDHQLGKLNDLGMKLGGLAIAMYLYTLKTAPVTKAMEFVGLGSFFASMALWPKIALDIPARLLHGFSPFMRYEDNQGRKKRFFSDNQFIPFDMLNDKQIERIGNRLKVPMDLPNRRDAIEEKMRKIALQNNTMWMLTAGFATPILSSLICNRLEPYVDNLHSIYLNKKADGLLSNLKNAKDKYMSDEITKQVNDLITLNHDKPINEKLIEDLSHALSLDFGSKVRIGIKKDLEEMFVDGKYRFMESQLKQIASSINQGIRDAAEGSQIMSEVLDAIIPTEQQLKELFIEKKYFEKSLDDVDLSFVLSDISGLLRKNMEAQKNAGNVIEPYLYSRFGKAVTDNECLQEIFKSVPSNVLNMSAQNKILELANIMQNFNAEHKLLMDYLYKKLAFAPNTAKAKYWNDFVNSLVKTLKITPKEIEDTRYDRKLVGELLNQRMWELSTAEPEAYKEFIKALSENIKKNGKYIKSDFAEKYFENVTNSYSSAANMLREKGFNYAAERIIGNGSTERGALIGVIKSYVNNSLLNIRSTFASVINKANVMRLIYEHPDFSFLNDGKIPKEIKEEIVAAIEYLTTEGRIADYSVKFDFRRNLNPNLTDDKDLKFVNGVINYEYYNPKNIEKNGGCKKMDTAFFKRVMKTLFGTQLSENTKAAISSPEVLKMLEEYRNGMYNEVGNVEDFMYPYAITGEIKYDGSRVSPSSYTSQNPKTIANQVGSALDEMLANTLRQKYNTNKWLKTFGGLGAGLLGFTVLSQLFFGRDKHYKRGRKV